MNRNPLSAYIRRRELAAATAVRARIVAWLRAESDRWPGDGGTIEWLAKAIEDGDHAKPPDA